MKDLPNKQDILAWIQENPSKAGKRDIARAFGIKGAARVDLKRMLAELQKSGDITRDRKSFRDKDALPPVSVMLVVDQTADGDILAEPAEFDGDGPPPRALFIAKKGDPALARGDRFLGRLTRVKADPPYETRLIKKLGSSAPKALGIFHGTGDGGRIVPVDKKSDREWLVPGGETNGAKDGELVEAERIGGRERMGLPRARVIERLGDPHAPRSISLIAIHQHGIPDEFPEDVIAAAASAKPVSLGRRTDLRDTPLVTIDPADARDHDDAIAAIPDDDPKNEGGFVLWVAIADVAHYVRPGTALDREARNRGNSTYFPDRVVPMLPDALSGDLCSLHEGVERPCMALQIRIDAHGEKLEHSFHRALMKSHASLNYVQAQAAADGHQDDQTAPMMDTVITPLFDAYAALARARIRRAPLDLDLPERKIELSEDGKVESIQYRDRFDAHKLVEEFMVLANVCAAESLEAKRRRFLYRVHEEPSPEKLDALRETADSMGLTLAKGQVLKTSHLNRLLHDAAETDHAQAVNITVLRSMTQAYYAPSNLGHFGLALTRYAHFTSPIRRYADLVVHRALIAANGWGDDGLSAEEETILDETGTHISQTERRSMVAERDTNDRYLSAYLADRIGNEFAGSISGVARFGLFVRLDETGADGLIPAGTLGREFYRFNEDTQTLTGEDSNRRLGLGMRVTIRLAEATPITGGLIFELLDVEGKPLPQGRKRSKSNPKGRKLKRGRRN